MTSPTTTTVTLMDYRHEIKKMKRHRKRYRPAMAALMGMHAAGTGLPADLTGRPDMLIILELLDIGYLDPEAFHVKKKFGDIAGVWYNGRYPLSEGGEALYSRGIIARVLDFFRGG